MNVLAYFRSIFMPVIGKLGSSKLWITFELRTASIESILFCLKYCALIKRQMEG